MTEQTDNPTQDGAQNSLPLPEVTNRVLRLEHRISDPDELAQDLEPALPRAIRLASAEDSNLSISMRPVVEKILQKSVRRNPGMLANVLFPVIGAAVRRAVKDMFARLIQSINQTMAHRFSWKSLKWRIQAWRSGQPFAMIVLYNTLLYRVEQVYVIHRETGIPLAQNLAEDAMETADGDLMTSMLTAIQDFAKDSFNLPEDVPVGSLEMGDLEVWIEAGPLAYLAVVFRGNVPRVVRSTMQRILEEFHETYFLELENFEGDTEEFQGAKHMLAECMEVAYRDDGKPKRGALGLSFVLILLLLGLGFVEGRKTWFRMQLENHLVAEPGIWVGDVSRVWGGYRLNGLRDPLARPVADVVADMDLPIRLTDATQPYYSLEPEMLSRRTARLSEAPESVQFSVDADSIVHARGEASSNWIARAKGLSPPLGVKAIDWSEVRPPNYKPPAPEVKPTLPENLDELAAEIESFAFYFEAREVSFAKEQQEPLTKLAELMKRITEKAQASNRQLEILIEGFAHDTDNLSQDRVLAYDRAKRVRDALKELGVPAEYMTLRGFQHPDDEQSIDLMRRVNCRVTLDGG